MLRTRSVIDRLFGTAWAVNGDAIHRHFSYLENAGSPQGVVTPDFFNQACYDTTSNVMYRAMGTDSASWRVDIDPLAGAIGQGGGILAGSTLAVTAALHNRRTILLDQLAGSVCTLPAATGSGAKFKFLVFVLATSVSHKIQVANATDFFIGTIAGVSDDPATVKGWIAANSGTVATNSDTVTLNRTTSGSVSKGEWVEVEDIAAATWSITGMITQTGVEITPFTAAV